MLNEWYKNTISKYTGRTWTIGFVHGGMQSVMESDNLQIDALPLLKDRMLADPFILDVNGKDILLLVEDMSYATNRGAISLLHINKSTMQLVSRKVLLELPTHMSFPAILRKDGRIYVYPESRQSGHLDMYEYHPDTESLTFVQTICDAEVWDSYITEAFGEPYLFTASHDDYILDIYKWDKKKERFIPYQQILSEKANSRLGGAVFEYEGTHYYPAQDSTKVYGGALDIKRIDKVDNKFYVETVKHHKSMNSRFPVGLHTLNEYKGVIVVDVKGFIYGKLGAVLLWLDENRKKLKRKLKRKSCIQ